MSDEAWMDAALALASRGRGRCAPNPNVGCVIVRDHRVVGRGWTQPGGRPHAEAVALNQAGDAARGATAYVTLEPCAHDSIRGPACSALLVAAGVARVVVALRDPDPRTDGSGVQRLREAGIEAVVGVCRAEAKTAIAGFLTRRRRGRPHVTLKLGVSLDGRVALEDGSSKWITGPAARAHAHLERSRHEAILVGRGTWEADEPGLNVRLAGLEERSPRCVILSSRPLSFPKGTDYDVLKSPGDIASLEHVDHLLVEGGSETAAAFLAAELVDRLILYRAPILIGAGPGIGDLGLTDLADAHGKWSPVDSRMLGSDRLEVYERA